MKTLTDLRRRRRGPLVAAIVPAMALRLKTGPQRDPPSNRNNARLMPAYETSTTSTLGGDPRGGSGARAWPDTSAGGERRGFRPGVRKETGQGQRGGIRREKGLKLDSREDL